jgi:hypothetical protein
VVGDSPVCAYPTLTMDCAMAGGSCSAGSCLDAPASPGEGELVVTEIMRNPAPENRQWFEVKVLADGERNLAGCGVADGAGNVFVFPKTPVIVSSGDFVLVAEDAPVSDGLPIPDVTMAAGSLDLMADAGPLVVNCMGTMVDIVDYPSQSPLSPFPAEVAVSMQVGPGAYSAELNDTPTAWCNAPDPYTFGSYGSPGEANPSCNTDIDKCQLWFPAFDSVLVGEVLVATAIVHDQGITDQTIFAPDPTPDLLGQLGLGPDGVNPELAPDDFEWFDAEPEYNPPAGVPASDDMYGAWLTPEVTGVRDLAARFTPDSGLTWLYCDLDGSNNGYQIEKAGHVVVQP